MLRDLITKAGKAVKALATRTVLIESDRIPYRFERVPLRKILNWIRVEASMGVKPEKPWGRPTHLQIEPTALCNLHCALCHVTEGMNRPTGHMDPGLFKKLIDEIGDSVFLILLWDWGEPLLNPAIYDMIPIAQAKGIKVVTSTNGHLLAQRENADRLIRSGLDSLIIALDGITQETYSKYRQGGNVETVLEGVRMIVDRKRALGSDTPFVNLRFLVMTHNEHEIPDLKALAESLGVDALSLKTVNPHSDNLYSDERSAEDEDGTEFFPTDTRYRRFDYAGDGRTRIRVQNNPCKSLWNMPVVHWDGTVCACTYDYDEKFKLGDLRESSFREIWTGDAYRSMRRQFRSDWETIGMCCNCSFAYQGGNCITESIADVFFFKGDR